MPLSRRAQRRFDEHQQVLADDHSELTLHLDVQRGRASVEGALRTPVGGGLVAAFNVSIRFQKLNPFQLPDTYDPVGQFPRLADRHIEPNGRFCLWLPQTAPTDFDQPDGLALHLERVRRFLVLQRMYDTRAARGISPRWAGPQWKHNEHGHRQWLDEQFAALPTLDVTLLRRDLLGGRPHSPDSPCPCRSGRSYRRCHRPTVLRIRDAAVADHTARYALVQMLKEKT